MSEQTERLKRMARNAGASMVNNCDFQPVQPELSFDDGDLLHFAMAIAEECAETADAAVGHAADAIRNLYRDQS